jgi:phytoene dehydrogenase-like protein
MSRKIAVIGAGIAGLSAGVYGRLNGFDTQIYEMHKVPGGLCTSWKRRDFTFDGCIHWLTGSAPKDTFYQLWQELGAIEGRRFVDHDIFQSHTGPDGRTFNLYTNVDQLEAHMLELSPQDSGLTAKFCQWIRKFTRFGMPMDKAFELFSFPDILRMMIRMSPFMKDMNRMTGMTIAEFSGRFRDPLIRESLNHALGEGVYPLLNLVVTLSLLHNRAGGYPIGGSLAFARSIEKKFLDLGGQVHYGAKVDRILTEADGDKGRKAVGIRLENGTEVSADYVISAADLRYTVDHLLEGRFIEPQHEELFRSVPLAPSSVMVFFGLNRKFNQPVEAASYVFDTSEPFLIGNEAHNRVYERNFNYDPTLAPEGKSIICTLMAVRDFGYWEELKKDHKSYLAEKVRITKTLTAIFEARYPGFREAVEVSDVVTPMTYVRYTGVYKGTYMTWIMTGENARRFRMVRKTLPGLDNFWLSGMWVLPPGGVPTGAKTSRDIIQMICKREKIPFRV